MSQAALLSERYAQRWMQECSTNGSWSPQGAAPEAAMVGDDVFVLVGCSVLRKMLPEPNEYAVVGECYVYGFMDGEAVRLRDRGELTVCDFVLR